MLANKATHQFLKTGPRLRGMPAHVQNASAHGAAAVKVAGLKKSVAKAVEPCYKMRAWTCMGQMQVAAAVDRNDGQLYKSRPTLKVVSAWGHNGLQA